MTKYLDENGLAYFWTKIKAWLSSHAPVKYFGQNWIEDTNNDYALVVGNGVDENNPENASAITNDGIFLFMDNSLDPNIPPASNQYQRIIRAVDAEGDTRAALELSDWATGPQGVGLKASRLINGDLIYHGVNFSITPNGEKLVSFDYEDGLHAWQSALNYWLNTFSIKSGSLDLTKSNNNVNSDNYTPLNIMDSNQRLATRLENKANPNGNNGFYLYSRNYDSNGNSVRQAGIGISIDKSGNTTWTIDEPQGFRKALNLGQSDGAFPLTFAQGGTNMTGAYWTNTISNVISAASGCTITEVSAVRWGKLATIRIGFAKSSAISVPADGNIGNFDVGTLKAGWRPRLFIYGGASSDNNNMNCRTQWDNDGKIAVQAFEGSGSARTISANTHILISATYTLAD